MTTLITAGKETNGDLVNADSICVPYWLSINEVQKSKFN